MQKILTPEEEAKLRTGAKAIQEEQHRLISNRMDAKRFGELDIEVIGIWRQLNDSADAKNKAQAECRG